MAEKVESITPEALKKEGFTGLNVADFYTKGNIGVYEDCLSVYIYPESGRGQTLAKGVKDMSKLRLLINLLNG